MSAGAKSGATATAARRRVSIVNARGLHARAAAKLAKAAGAFKSDITVTKGELTVSALSIMGLMMLAASPGTEIDLEAHGADADAAIEGLAALIRAGFDEDDDEVPDDSRAPGD